MKKWELFVVLLSAVVLAACDDEQHKNEENKLSEVSVYSPQEVTQEQAELTAEGALSLNDFVIDDVDLELRTLNLSANKAPILGVLQQLADHFSFSIKSDVNYGGEVTGEYKGVTVEHLINDLLDDNDYSIAYRDNSDYGKPEISALTIGKLLNESDFKRNQSSYLKASVVSSDELAEEYAINFPFSGVSTQLAAYDGTDINYYQNVEQLLETASLEEIMYFINDVDLDSSGLRSLSEVFYKTPDNEIKKEIISALSNSDSFSSKWLVLSALKSESSSVVKAALEEIEVWQDPSVLPYVTEAASLQNDPEIVELANNIVEINSSVSTETLIHMTQEERAQEFRMINNATAQDPDYQKALEQYKLIQQEQQKQKESLKQ